MNRFGIWMLMLFLVGGLVFVVLLGPGARTPGRRVQSGGPVTQVGALPIPVSGVVAAQLTDTWDDSRTGGGAHVHNAIDIMAPRGTAVTAAMGGSVEKIFESRLGGHTLYLRSADGNTVTYYAHLDSYAPGLAEGQVVKAGDVIGRVGSSGDASADAPHLHFEVHRMARGERWYQGTGINPYPLLTGKLAG